MQLRTLKNMSDLPDSHYLERTEGFAGPDCDRRALHVSQACPVEETIHKAHPPRPPAPALASDKGNRTRLFSSFLPSGSACFAWELRCGRTTCFCHTWDGGRESERAQRRLQRRPAGARQGSERIACLEMGGERDDGEWR